MVGVERDHRKHRGTRVRTTKGGLDWMYCTQLEREIAGNNCDILHEQLIIESDLSSRIKSITFLIVCPSVRNVDRRAATGHRPVDLSAEPGVLSIFPHTTRFPCEPVPPQPE